VDLRDEVILRMAGRGGGRKRVPRSKSWRRHRHSGGSRVLFLLSLHHGGEGEDEDCSELAMLRCGPMELLEFFFSPWRLPSDSLNLLPLSMVEMLPPCSAVMPA
jgi:hypothetical protein